MKKLIPYLSMLIFLTFLSGCTKEAATDGDTGTGGSMARFTIRGNYLYTVDYEYLHTFNISNPAAINYLQKQYLGFGIETIFPTDDYLFFGASNGMHIYDLETPEKPRKMSFTPHFVAYDPVVVQGNFAYVTLRDGQGVGGRLNQLMVYNISRPDAPELLAEYPMTAPRGLGIDGNRLFICDNQLKVFAVTDGFRIELTHAFDISALDVIPKGNILYVVAEDGLYQYAYDGETVQFISKLTIPRKEI